MGCVNGKRQLASNLTQTQIDILMENTKLSENEIRKWYKDFYDASKGKNLDEESFVKYYQELLPYRGNVQEFCSLVFKGNSFKFILFPQL